MDSANHSRRRAVTSLLALLAVTAIISATAGAAFASAPPYEPDPNSIGGLIFFNSAGQQITTGSISDAPFATYVQATTPGRASDDKATLYGYLPKNGQPIGAW